MCNLSEGIEERSLARGMAKGRAEGIMETLFSLVKKGLLTVSAAAQQAGMDISTFEKSYRTYCGK